MDSQVRLMEAEIVPPESFVAVDHRLFIDTNVFMDTDPVRSAGLKKLFERCKDAAIGNANGIVVPSKVIDELIWQSGLDTSAFPDDRAAAVERARKWLEVLKELEVHRVVRNNLGDGSNPYADDLFAELFSQFGGRYNMCLLTNDITLTVRIRLLAVSTGHRLVAGTVSGDGQVEQDGDQSLYDRAVRKLTRITRKTDEGLAKSKDIKEAASLTSLLDEFRRALPVAAGDTGSIPKQADKLRAGESPRRFKRVTTLKPKDELLPDAAIPGAGDRVFIGTADSRVALQLGGLLGEGGEGSVYAIEEVQNQVVKIFHKSHRTTHRKAKLEILVERVLCVEGIGFPTGLITNADGAFVGYSMPKASGKELQATIMRPARFRRVYPNWTKADLVDVCISFLEKVEYLQSLNVLLGDINPKNLMVDEQKNVWIIDADSWQVEGYPCPVGTAMFTAPSITGDYANSLRTVEEERFAVATMLFMILITGQFPYARAGADGGDFATLIREGKFTFQFKGASDRDQPEGNWKFMWSHLPPRVKSLFWNTFQKEGGSRYDRRPTAGEWLAIFREYRSFFGSADDFDPMSNDVYPIRFKAFKPDTPILDCPGCGRQNAIAYTWDDQHKSYVEQTLCYTCNQIKPRCADCGKSKSVDQLKDGLCLDCRPMPCKDCGKQTRKPELQYGRCPACVKKGTELDPNRLCSDCRQPFITYDHQHWFTSKGLDIPKSHLAIKKACPTGASAPQSARPARNTTSAPRSVSATTAPGLLERLVKWLFQ
jgi:serine/threonine protein kinase/predicted nucleic acid-binding protein